MQGCMILGIIGTEKDTLGCMILAIICTERDISVLLNKKSDKVNGT